jgi:hypothetical protein
MAKITTTVVQNGTQWHITTTKPIYWCVTDNEYLYSRGFLAIGEAYTRHIGEVTYSSDKAVIDGVCEGKELPVVEDTENEI